MPNLLELQKKSYRWFLDEGLQEVFTDVASITNYAGNLELSFIGYKMDEAPSTTWRSARRATPPMPLRSRSTCGCTTTRRRRSRSRRSSWATSAHDPVRHLRHQRRRARGRQPDRPLPGRVLTARRIDLKTDLPLLTSTVIPAARGWCRDRHQRGVLGPIDKNRKIPITELIRAIGGQAEQYADLKTDTGILDLFRRRRPHQGLAGEGRLQDL